MEAKTAPQQFTALFHKYKDRTYEFALRMLGDECAAGDVTQEVFLRLYERQQNNHQYSDVKSWLFIVARNLCLNHIRDRGRQLPLSDYADSLAGIDPAVDSRRRALQQAISALEPPYREALILKVYQGFSYREMAEILGRTVPAVRSLLFKARSMLRDKMGNM